MQDPEKTITNNLNPACNEFASCDTCQHYKFNGGGLAWSALYQCKIEYPANVYTGKGFCELHGRRQDPEDECSDHKCVCSQKPIHMDGGTHNYICKEMLEKLEKEYAKSRKILRPES